MEVDDLTEEQSNALSRFRVSRRWFTQPLDAMFTPRNSPILTLWKRAVSI